MSAFEEPVGGGKGVAMARFWCLVPSGVRAFVRAGGIVVLASPTPVVGSLTGCTPASCTVMPRVQVQQLSGLGKGNGNINNTASAASSGNSRSRSGSVGSGTDSDASSFGNPLSSHTPPVPTRKAPTPHGEKAFGSPPVKNGRQRYSMDEPKPGTLDGRPRANTASSPKPRPNSMGRAMWSVFSSTGGMGSAALASGLGVNSVSPFGPRVDQRVVARHDAQHRGRRQSSPPPRQADRGQKRDWKLSADDLSLITSEEERVMPPEILKKLLAAGAGVHSECPVEGFS